MLPRGPCLPPGDIEGALEELPEAGHACMGLLIPVLTTCWLCSCARCAEGLGACEEPGAKLPLPVGKKRPGMLEGTVASHAAGRA
eukprot:1158980-Pelagomonas_calceolata.AAC.3